MTREPRCTDRLDQSEEKILLPLLEEPREILSYSLKKISEQSCAMWAVEEGYRPSRVCTL